MLEPDYFSGNYTDLIGLADKALAMDLLMSAKTGVKMCGMALTEIATPELRETVRDQMQEMTILHEKITTMMLSKGWYHPYNVDEQFKLDRDLAGTALTLAKMELFPDNTSRLGLYQTPDTSPNTTQEGAHRTV